MKYSKIPVAQSIVLLCLKKGIDHVVISPGSRNAPLTIGFAHHTAINSYSIVDERSAAFLPWALHSNCRNRWPWYALPAVRS